MLISCNLTAPAVVNTYEAREYPYNMHKVVEIRGRRSDTGQFEALIRPHFAALYNAAHRLTAMPADAEDLVQEVCIKAYRNRERLKGMDYPRAWLLRTLYNRFVDDQRGRQRSPQAAGTESDETTELAGPDGLQPEQETQRIMNIEAIQFAMMRLGSDQRALLGMHDIDGLSLAEIQSVTGLPEGTIKSKLHRARCKLGKLLHQEEDGDVSSIIDMGRRQ